MQEQRLQRSGTNTTAGLYIPAVGGGIKGSGDGEGNHRWKQEKKKEIWGKYNF